MPVTIAPSIRSQLRKITAKERSQTPLPDPKGMKAVTELLSSAAALHPSSGRFWDSDSESEYEDLGDVEAHRPAEPSVPAVKPAVPAVARCHNPHNPLLLHHAGHRGGRCGRGPLLLHHAGLRGGHCGRAFASCKGFAGGNSG
jgi:hypothetical protein